MINPQNDTTEGLKHILKKYCKLAKNVIIVATSVILSLMHIEMTS